MRLLERVARIIEPKLDRSALYPARVVRVVGRLVSCAPFDARLPGQVDVPQRTLVPSESFLAAGSRCLLGFDTRGELFVVAWDAPAGVVTLAGSAGKEVAGVGDLVEVNPPKTPIAITGAVVGGTVAGTAKCLGKLKGSVVSGSSKVLVP